MGGPEEQAQQHLKKCGRHFPEIGRDCQVKVKQLMKLPKTDAQAVQQSFILWHKHNKKKSKGGGTEMNINPVLQLLTFLAEN